MPPGTPVATAPLANVRVLWPKGLNTSIYLDLNRFSRQTPWAHGFMHAYALWLGPVLLTIVFLAAYAVVWWRRAAHSAALLFLGGLGTVIALGLNQLVAHAAQELRPYDSHPQALVLVAKTHDYSFPSDHSVVAGGLTVAVLLLLAGSAGKAAGAHRRGAPKDARGQRTSSALKGLAVANVVLGLFLCFARVYAGAHYPGDVVAGYLLSALVVVLVSLVRPLAYRLVEQLVASPVGVLVSRPLAWPAEPVAPTAALKHSPSPTTAVAPGQSPPEAT